MKCPSSVGVDRRPVRRGPRLIAPLAHRDFALLWSGTALSLVGDGVYAVAIAWQVYELSNAASALAAVGLAWTVPQLGLFLFAGLVADRRDRRRVLIAADLARAAALGLLGALSLAGVLELWMVFALVAMYGVGEAFHAPTFLAVVPQVVPRRELVQANALEHSVRPLALRLAGPALGGVLVAAAGAGGALLVDAVTFAACAGAVLLMRELPSPASLQRPAWRAELAEGARYVRERPWLWTTLTAAAIGLLGFYGPVTVLVPWLARNRLGAGAAEFGLILAAGGVGAIAAAVVVGQAGLPGRPLRVVYASWSVGALAIAGYGLAAAVWQAVVVSVVVQGAMTVGAIAWGGLLQQAVPAGLLGRVSSLDWLASTALVPVSLALTAPAAALLGPRTVLVGAGVLSGAALMLLGARGAPRAHPERRARTSVPTRRRFWSAKPERLV